MSVHILCVNCPWPFTTKWPWTIFTQLYFCLVKYGQNVKINLAGPGPALPGLTKGLRMRIGADLHELFFIEKTCVRPILVISGPSRPQKWIRLEILR